jgi:ABC-type microcin C transport system duplicated ATPase subunit YejF
LSGLRDPPAARSAIAAKSLAALSRAEAQQWHREVQIVFQDPHAALDPRMRVFDSVGEPLRVAHAGTRGRAGSANHGSAGAGWHRWRNVCPLPA